MKNITNAADVYWMVFCLFYRSLVLLTPEEIKNKTRKNENRISDEKYGSSSEIYTLHQGSYFLYL